MPASIFEVFTAPNIVGYINERAAAVDDAYLGAVLFPSARNAGLDLSWIKNRTGLDVALRPSSFDVKAELRNRIGIGKIDTEMGFFKEAMRIGEKDRQDILRLNEAYARPIIERIYNDVYNLVRGADVQAERMRMQLLSTGKIDVSVDGAGYFYDYKFKPEHKETISASEKKWNQLTTADPLDDIERWQAVIRNDGGGKPSRAICSTKVWGYIKKNVALRKALNPVGAVGIKPTNSDVKEFIYDQVGVVVEVYDKVYATEPGGAGTPYFPDDVFTLIPEGVLGNTWYGTTPEEADLLTGKVDADVAIVGSGIAVTVTRETDPVNVNTKVSAVMLPSFPAINSVFIADVA